MMNADKSDTPSQFVTFIQKFTQSQSLDGMVLIFSALLAFIWANSPWSSQYFALKETPLGIRLGASALEKPLALWVNDGLMAIFFFLVGLEIKRERLLGELSNLRNAILTILAAVGGMIVPAAIYATVNWGRPGIQGWGVPMATDIAFALGVLSLLGNRVTPSLKVFLTALAIIDDLGAVLIIALFYTADLHWLSLLYSLGVLAAAFTYARAGGRTGWVFALLGVVMWYFMLKSGVHPTVAGVLLAFAVPIRRKLGPNSLRSEFSNFQNQPFEDAEDAIERTETLLAGARSPLHRMERLLHPWVAFLVMPVFAFLNAGVDVTASGSALSPVAQGAFFGLILGKPIGVLSFSWLGVRLGWASLPSGSTWIAMAGTGLLAGIGFTMSLFIAGLAFEAPELLDQAKIGVLTASVLSAVVGLWLMSRATRPT
jgi:Na+:H+ antiporter, NhaA family